VHAVTENLDAVGLYLREWRALPAPELARLRARRRSMRALFEDVIRDGIRKREFASADAKISALAILGMCNWVYEWYRPRGRLGRDELADEFAERGGMRRDDVRSWIEEATNRWRGDAVRAGERAGATLQSALRELGLVTRDEWDELELRVAQVEHRLRLLESRPRAVS
jgi:polyhydroxyalkanoate synthesis regulator phasin